MAAEPETARVSSTAARWFLAAMSFGAAAIHLVMVPAHAQESLAMGLAFAAAGWCQLAVGVAVLTRPLRRWARLGAAANLAFLAAWVLSRTAGLPTWTGDGGVQDPAPADLLCVLFEVGFVVGAVALLLVPHRPGRQVRSVAALAAVLPVGVLAATTAVLTAPSTAQHGQHGEHGGHGPGEAMANGDGHTGHTGDGGATGDGGHDHAGSDVTYDELPEPTRTEVDQLIARWADRYPTARDAMADGWFQGTRNLYGIGAHYIRENVFDGAGTFELLEPNILLFGGDGPDAPFAGVSYTMAEEPEGFTGPYDSWHAHNSICMGDGGVISLTEDDSPVWLSESDCIDRGGNVMPLSSAEMIHVWIGPAYRGDTPVFAHDHPALYDGFNPQRDA
jgi:hypothetical protein